MDISGWLKDADAANAKLAAILEELVEMIPPPPPEPPPSLFGPYTNIASLFTDAEIFRYAPENDAINPLDTVLPLFPSRTAYGWGMNQGQTKQTRVEVDPIRGPVTVVPYPAGMPGGGSPITFQGSNSWRKFIGPVFNGASAVSVGASGAPKLVTVNTLAPNDFKVGDTVWITVLSGSTSYQGPVQVGAILSPVAFTCILANYQNPTGPLGSTFTVQKVSLPTRIAIAIRVRISDNWTDNKNVGTKFFFLRGIHPDAGRDRTTITGVAGQNHMVGLTAGNPSGDVMTFICGLQGGGVTNGGSRNFGSQYPLAVSYPRGRWVRYELVVESNTDGLPNGKLLLWVTDEVTGVTTKLIDESVVPWHALGQSRGFNAMQFSPTYGGGLNPVPADQDFRIADSLVALKGYTV